jgi:RNA polymerase sigma factor (sigma-70 family)
VNDSLTELLARCATGDESAVETLVGRFQPWALGFAGALLDDKSAAPDIVQESFITALGKLHSLRDPDAFPGWFRQIIRTRVSHANRKRTECPLGESREPVSDRPSPREALDLRRLSAIVRDAVASLPPASRVTTELYYFDQMKHTDIASQLGLPRGTVKRRLHDARRSLRTMLAGLVEEPRQTNPHPENPFGRNHNEDNRRRL